MIKKQRMPSKIIYTHTDEAPALATKSLLPIVKAFAIGIGSKAQSPNKPVKITRNRPSKKLIDGLLHKVWGKKKYKPYAIKKFLNKYA